MIGVQNGGERQRYGRVGDFGRRRAARLADPIAAGRPGEIGKGCDDLADVVAVTGMDVGRPRRIAARLGSSVLRPCGG